MKHLRPYRLATYVLLLFCAGHTAGGMIAQPSFGLAADAVFAAMKTVHFDFNGADSTWYGFWFAFGLTASLFILFAALTAWQLDQVEPAAWPAVAPIAWALVVALGLQTVLSWMYFFAGPGIFGILATGLTAVGAWRKGRGK